VFAYIEGENKQVSKKTADKQQYPGVPQTVCVCSSESTIFDRPKSAAHAYILTHLNQLQ